MIYNTIKELDAKEVNIAKNAADEIDKNGVVIIKDFIPIKDCEEIKKLLIGGQLRNSNELTFVYIDDAKFFSNAIAQSKTAYNLVTSKIALSISKSYLGGNIRLKCHRAYTTKKNYFFPWHTDNKFDDKKNDKKGVVFIIYLVDTINGATEFILGSHKESHIYNNNLFLEQDINSKYKDRICKAVGKAGYAVISDTRVIHRGSVASGKNINRYSFFFQVDANLNQAERLLLNPEFLPKSISNELSEYLGFSSNFGLDVHPVTTNIDRILPYNLRVCMFLKYFMLTILIPFHWIRLKMPIKIKILLNKIFKKKIDWN